jgi:hypothetical protein
MSGQVKDFNQELVLLYLEERGYLAAFGITCAVECGRERSLARADHEIDVLAVRVEGGTAQSAILGCVKGYWTVAGSLSPSHVRSLEDEKKTFTRAFAEERLRFVRGRYGLGGIPIRKVLFYSQRSPKKAAEAEAMLAAWGIEVVYLEDILAEVMPRLAKEPFLASSTALQTIRALRGSAVFSPARRAEKPAETKPKAAAAKKTKADGEVRREPQLALFPGGKG